MRIRLSLVLFVMLLFAAVWCISVISGYAATGTRNGAHSARSINAHERASVKACQRRDETFSSGLLSDDAANFSPTNPYFKAEPKRFFPPQSLRYAEQLETFDASTANPRVQTYGNAAFLIRNNVVKVNSGGPVFNYANETRPCRFDRLKGESAR